MTIRICTDAKVAAAIEGASRREVIEALREISGDELRHTDTANLRELLRQAAEVSGDATVLWALGYE